MRKRAQHKNFNDNLAAIIIPVSSEIPTELEQISLERCFKILKNYPIIFVVPDGLNTAWYSNNLDYKCAYIFEKFGNEYFGSTERHSRLLLSELFYKRFLKYQYILIHHLDAFVFEDTLSQWCNRNYYYVGAPWLEDNWHENLHNIIAREILMSKSLFKRYVTKIKWKLLGLNKREKLLVGNGGLSLRCVHKFHIATILFKEVIKNWKFNEDVFWSIYIPLNKTSFKLPPWRIALNFSFDINPRLCFEINRNKLPFGSHAWFRKDIPYKGNFDFWKDKVGNFQK